MFQELNKKSYSKQIIAKKLCIELNWQTCQGIYIYTLNQLNNEMK